MDNESQEATEAARRRYDRIAGLYDLTEGLLENWRFAKWRQILWGKAERGNILEVGAGTGKNFPYYHAGSEMTAIDFSGKMLARAREKAQKNNVRVHLMLMDVQKLEFPDNSFDTVVGTFVFCSVPDPVIGLKEVRRVVKPGGRVLLLEHVISTNKILAAGMNALNPLWVRAMGANIDRRTEDNVGRSGLAIDAVTDLGGGIFKLIEASKT